MKQTIVTNKGATLWTGEGPRAIGQALVMTRKLWHNPEIMAGSKTIDYALDVRVGGKVVGHIIRMIGPTTT
ncbi:Uncharacterised protein [Mycobacteroides abscessus subsp. abscessus]|nr:Uncharacterised protein [Mycobacteroides abscessus subsp. abscessus]